MTPKNRRDVGVRTPSSAMLVQMLFVISAVGTGAVAALVTWMGPKRESASEKKETKRDE